MIRPEIRKLRGELTRIRRHIHQNPELGFKEIQTSNFIESYLRRYGIATRRIAGTGIVGLIRGRAGGNRTILFRADIDGLPVREENRIPFASRHPGVMHA